MKVTLTTKRLILRPFELTDDKAIFENWANDPEVTKYLTWNAYTDINKTKEILSLWVKQYEKPERINFGIVLKETKRQSEKELVDALNNVRIDKTRRI